MKELDKGEVPGPGEILSELSAGLRIKVLEGGITSFEAQAYFNRIQRELSLFALANPGIPWDTGSTQVEALSRREKELRAARNNGAKISS